MAFTKKNISEFMDLFLVLTKIKYFMCFMTIFSKYWFINIKVWILFIEV